MRTAPVRAPAFLPRMGRGLAVAAIALALGAGMQILGRRKSEEN